MADFTDQNIQDTYQRVVQIDEGQLQDGTGSALPIKIEGNDVIIPGALRANSYIVSESIINVSSGSTIFGNSSDDTHTFTGNITSSGNISSSGQINADKIRAGEYAGSSVFDIAAGAGGIDTDGAISCTGFSNSSTSTFGGRIILTGASAYIETPSYVSASKLIVGDITSSGNISASGKLTAASTTTTNLTLNPSDDSIFKIFSTDLTLIAHEIHGRGNVSSFLAIPPLHKIGIGLNNDETPQAKLHVSGNISASGDIIGGNDLTIIKLDGTPAVFTLNSPNDGFGRPFTITNNGSEPTINAQDILRLHADDGDVEIKLDASGQDKIIFSTTPAGGGSTLTERYKIDNAGNHLFSSNISASGEIKTDSHITASGNISASGNIISENSQINANLSIGGFITSNVDNTFGNFSVNTTHVTASGNISASGRIYGRQLEQHDMSAGGFAVSQTPTFFPFGGQSHLESTTNTNQNIQKISVVQGKPIRVVIKSCQAGDALGNTGYTCSYHATGLIDGAAGIPKLIGEQRANSTGTNHEAVIFDFTNGVTSGSYDDVPVNERIYMTLQSDTSVSSIQVLGATALWEWDYNSI